MLLALLLAAAALGAGPSTHPSGRALRQNSRDSRVVREAAPEPTVVVSSPPPPPPPAPIVSTVHHCTCKSVWTFDGATYAGCDPHHPAWKRPWCLVEQPTGGHCGWQIRGGASKHTDDPSARWDFCYPPASELQAYGEAKAMEALMQDRARAGVTAVAAFILVSAFVAARSRARRAAQLPASPAAML